MLCRGSRSIVLSWQLILCGFAPLRETVLFRAAPAFVVRALFTSASVLAQDAKVARLKASREQLIRGYTRQGRPVVVGELLLVRAICELSHDQLRPIARDADQELADFVGELVDERVLRLKRQTTPSTSDVTKELQQRLAIAIKKHLRAEQWVLYKSEIDKRDANRKQAALNFLLEKLDQELVLSSEQRAQIRETLSDHWIDRWYLFVEHLLVGDEFCEMELDQYVVPALNEGQHKLWQRFQKIPPHWGFGTTNFADDLDLVTELGLEVNARPKPAPPIKKGASD